MGTLASPKSRIKNSADIEYKPSHQTRISNLRKNAPQALAQAEQIKDSLNQ